jgi:hypothetical protein
MADRETTPKVAAPHGPQEPPVNGQATEAQTNGQAAETPLVDGHLTEAAETQAGVQQMGRVGSEVAEARQPRRAASIFDS